MNRSCVTQRGLLLLLVVSTSCPALYAGFRPEQHVIVQSETNGPESVYAADLDGDGDMDVLSASQYDDKIAWYANDGSGRFGDQHVITTEADGAICVYAADLDSDGDLDVLSASQYDDKIAWYANDGTGQFGPQQVITTMADGAKCVYAADIDGDGDLDVLSASSWGADRKIAWYANNGSGHFGSQRVITTAAEGTHSLCAVDLDGDGDLDLVADFPYEDTIAWFANDGTGQFGPQQVITTKADGAQSAYAADLDADGDLDVVSASAGDDKIAWYANDGTGQFGPQQVITTWEDGPRWVYAADLDGDGDLDVLSASGGYYPKIAWYANDASGHFGDQQVISTGVVGATCVYAADLDGDADLDVLSASLDDDKIAWYENDGSGQFGNQAAISTAVAGANHVYAADLDGDGDLDVLSAFHYDGKIAWYANDGSGHFGQQQVITTEAAGACSVHTADLDGDGDLDVLSASSGVWVWTGSGYADSKIAWYANDGSGHFGSQQVITTEVVNANSVYAADLDGDGDLDVLSGGKSIAWYENHGSGHFGSQQIITPEDWAEDSAFSEYSARGADLDGDGDVDILCATWRAGWGVVGDWKIAWYANDGSGHFGDQQVIATEDFGADSVYTADLDGDGDLDVLSALYWEGEGYGYSKIAWYANDGTGQFGPQQVINTEADASGARCVYAADLDGDGDLDVLSASEGVWTVYHTDSLIAWYANDGKGQFGPQQAISTAADRAKCVYAADLDADGDLDVLSASSEDDKIAWYENEQVDRTTSSTSP